MKTLFALAALTFSVGAFAACPNLAGSWKCQPAASGAAAYDLMIAQNDITGGTHYDITHSCNKTMGLDADGTLHTTTDAKGTVTVLGECNADGSLHVNVDAVSTDHSKEYVEDMMITMTDANAFTTKGSIKETMNGGQCSDKTIDTTCTRQATR